LKGLNENMEGQHEFLGGKRKKKEKKREKKMAVTNRKSDDYTLIYRDKKRDRDELNDVVK